MHTCSTSILSYSRCVVEQFIKFLCLVFMYFCFMMTQSWQGGLFVRPLRGFMLQTAEIYPQVSAGVEQVTCHLVQTARPSMPEEEG